MTDPHGGPVHQNATQTWSATAQVPVQTGLAPVSGPGYSAPVSGPGYSAPESSPGYSPGYSPAPMIAPKKGRGGTIALAVASGLLALATAAFGVLYFLAADARADAQAQLDQKTAALTTEEGRSKDLGAQLATSKEELAKLNQDLTGAKAKTDEVTKARDALAECFRAIENYARSKTSANAKTADEKCAEAEKHY